MSTTQYELLASVGEEMNDNVTVHLQDLLSTTVQPYKVPDSYFLLIRNIYFVLNGFIIWTGLLFNTTAMVVFLSSNTLRHTTTAHYLVALAVADSAYLFGDMFRWLSNQNHSFEDDMKYTDISNQYDVICKLTYVLRYSAQLCSSWITVAITTERFLTIKLPLKIGRISTPKIAKITIVLIFVVSILLSIYPIWFLSVYPHNGKDLCQMTEGSIETFTIMVWISLRVMTLILPSLIVMFFTVWIICLLKKRDRTQYELQAHAPATRASDRRSMLERQLTLMLVAVAIAFIILRVPYNIIWEINQRKRVIWKPLDLWFSFEIYVAYKILDILSTSNYAINFFLYSLCGSTFRKQLRKLCCCEDNARYKAPKSWSIGTVSSFLSRRSVSLSGSNSKITQCTDTRQINDLVNSHQNVNDVNVKECSI